MTTGGAGREAPGVAVWRTDWLPSSETFIVNQMRNLRDWRPVPVGLRTLAGADPIAKTARVVCHSRYGRVNELGSKLISLHPRPLAMIQSVLVRENVHLVHAHFAWDATILQGTLSQTALPLVVTCHGYDVTALPRSRSRSGVLFRRRFPALVARTSKFLAVSDFIAARLAELGVPEHQIIKSPIGIDVSAFESTVPASQRHGISFVGRLVEKKGAGDLLRAVSLLPGALKRTPVHIIGDGPMMPELVFMAKRLGLDCRFLGILSPSGVAGVLSSTKLFCVPSKTAESGDSEGLGMVFLEAAASGLPVVSYRHGGVREAVEHGESGILVSEGDVYALARGIHTLLADAPLAERFGRRGHDFVRRSYSIESCTRSLEKIYDTVSKRR